MRYDEDIDFQNTYIIARKTLQYLTYSEKLL
jgi:hypothetical protein